MPPSDSLITFTPELRTRSRSACGRGRRPSSYGGLELQSSTKARAYNSAAAGETPLVCSAKSDEGSSAEAAAPATRPENSRRFIESSGRIEPSYLRPGICGKAFFARLDELPPRHFRGPQPPVQPHIVVHHPPRREALARPIVSARPVAADEFAVPIELAEHFAEALAVIAFEIQRRVAPHLAIHFGIVGDQRAARERSLNRCQSRRFKAG